MPHPDNPTTQKVLTPVHLWPLLSFSNFSNDGPLIMFLPNTFVKLSDHFRKGKKNNLRESAMILQKIAIMTGSLLRPFATLDV